MATLISRKRKTKAKKGKLISLKRRPEKKKKLAKPLKAQKKVENMREITKPEVEAKLEKEKEVTDKGQLSETAMVNNTEYFRKLLLDMRQKLMEEISESRFSKSLIPSADIGDLVDQAGDERERELSLLLTSREKEKLLAINEALEKIDEGTYGICEECGEKIGVGRLKVMPLAKLCVTCQSKLEEEQSIQKKTEEDLTYRGLAFAPSLEEEE